MKQLLIYSCLGVCNLIPAKQGYVHISKKHFWPKISQGVVYTINIYSLCKNFFFGIFCMCYNLHIMQIINLHGQFAPNWKNSNYSKIVIFACKYTRIGIIACNIYQNWYICSVQTITVCAILSICRTSFRVGYPYSWWLLTVCISWHLWARGSVSG